MFSLWSSIFEYILCVWIFELIVEQMWSSKLGLQEFVMVIIIIFFYCVLTLSISINTSLWLSTSNHKQQTNHSVELVKEHIHLWCFSINKQKNYPWPSKSASLPLCNHIQCVCRHLSHSIRPRVRIRWDSYIEKLKSVNDECSRLRWKILEVEGAMFAPFWCWYTGWDGRGGQLETDVMCFCLRSS